MQSVNIPLPHQLRWFQRHAFQTGIVLILMIWTPLLTIHTLHIQHSDHPLIKHPGLVDPRPDQENNPPVPELRPNQDQHSQPSKEKSDSKSVIEQINEHPLPVGLAIGLIGASVAVLFGAPILVVTGIGAAASIIGSYIVSH